MISGHRRLFASQKIGLDSIPAIIKDMSDDEATISLPGYILTLLYNSKVYAGEYWYQQRKLNESQNGRDNVRRSSPSAFNNFKQNAYDFDELEQQLIANQ